MCDHLKIVNGNTKMSKKYKLRFYRINDINECLKKGEKAEKQQ